jgi:hypothetical protein
MYCGRAGRGEGFAVDASLIAADANKQRSIPGSEWQKTADPETASRAVREYLATIQLLNGLARCEDQRFLPTPTII